MAHGNLGSFGCYGSMYVVHFDDLGTATYSMPDAFRFDRMQQPRLKYLGTAKVPKCLKAFLSVSWVESRR